MRAKATPEGYHSLNPVLQVADVAAALAFYKTAFGAVEQFRREMHGKLLIAVIKTGDSHLMLAAQEVAPEKPAGGDPRSNGILLKIYVDAVDAVFRRAIEAGARQEEEVADQFFGERSGEVVDPFGFTWRLAALLEEVPHAEVERRMHERAAANRSH